MAAHTGRNDFTSADDNLLMQYIAKYRPEPAGRLGNALYKTLVENAERKWSWSRRHTWQSWRERYKKHQAEFDRRILKHQQKLAEKGQAKYAEEEQAEMGLKRKARDEPQASTHEKKRQKTGTLAQSNGDIGGAVNKECPAKEKPKEKSQAPPPQSKGQDADNEGQQNQAIPGDFPEEPMPDENNAPADQNPVASIYPDLNTAPSPGLSRPADPPPSGFSTSTPRPNGNAPTPPDSATKKPTSEVPKAADPVPAKPSQAPKPKPKKRRSSIHEDPFVSGSSSDHDNAPPPPLQRPSVRRQPPVYKEGAFRTTIQQSRPWPPVRKHHHSRPKPSNVQEPREQEQQTEVPPPPKDRVVQEQPHPPPPAPARRSSGNVVTSEASSSKVKLPPGHYHSREEVLDAVELPPNGAAGGTTEPHQPVNSELLNAPPKENFLAAPAPPATIHRTRLDDDPPRSISDSLRRRRPAAPSKPAESRVESVVITGASVTLVNDSGELDDRPIQLDDVFSDVRPPPRSPLVYTMQAPPPRIDLHKTLAMQRLRKRTRTRTRSSASSNSNKAPSVLSRTSSRASIAKGKAVVAPHKTATTCTTTPASPHSDAQLLQMAGRQVLLALAKRYGVTEDTVFKAYKRLKDLEKLNEYLAELQKQTEAAGEALMNSMIAEEGGEGEEGGGGGGAEAGHYGVGGGGEQDTSVFDLARVHPPGSGPASSRTTPSDLVDLRQVNKGRHSLATHGAGHGHGRGLGQGRRSSSGTQARSGARASFGGAQGHARRRSSVKPMLDIRPVHELPPTPYEPPRSTRAGRYRRSLRGAVPGELEMEALTLVNLMVAEEEGEGEESSGEGDEGEGGEAAGGRVDVEERGEVDRRKEGQGERSRVGLNDLIAMVRGMQRPPRLPQLQNMLSPPRLLDLKKVTSRSPVSEKKASVHSAGSTTTKERTRTTTTTTDRARNSTTRDHTNSATNGKDRIRTSRNSVVMASSPGEEREDSPSPADRRRSRSRSRRSSEEVLGVLSPDVGIPESDDDEDDGGEGGEDEGGEDEDGGDEDGDEEDREVAGGEEDVDEEGGEEGGEVGEEDGGGEYGSGDGGEEMVVDGEEYQDQDQHREGGDFDDERGDEEGGDEDAEGQGDEVDHNPDPGEDGYEIDGDQGGGDYEVDEDQGGDDYEDGEVDQEGGELAGEEDQAEDDELGYPDHPDEDGELQYPEDQQASSDDDVYANAIDQDSASDQDASDDDDEDEQQSEPSVSDEEDQLQPSSSDGEDDEDAMDVERLLSSPERTFDPRDPYEQAVQKWSLRHDELASKVTEENVKEFRAFEKEVMKEFGGDEDVMRVLGVLYARKLLDEQDGGGDDE